MSITSTSVDQLKRAIGIAEQIEKLQAELNLLLHGKFSATLAAAPAVARDPRRTKRSPAVRAKMAAAQKARWAKAKPGRAPSAAIIDEIAHIEAAGSTSAPSPKAKKAAPGKSIPLSELKVLLEAAPGKTLDVRRAGLQLANLKTLANANPHLLKLGGKGAWPTVTMLK